MPDTPEIRLAKNGDFVFSSPDQWLLFEVGGVKKGFGQIGEGLTIMLLLMLFLRSIRGGFRFGCLGFWVECI